MTQNQINLLKIQKENELGRANLAESLRHNRVTESEAGRHNLATEDQARADLISRDLQWKKNLEETNRANTVREAETHRSNVVNEIERERSNRANEYETRRSHLVNEGEMHRANLRNEEIKRDELIEKNRAATTAEGINQQRADTEADRAKSEIKLNSMKKLDLMNQAERRDAQTVYEGLKLQTEMAGIMANAGSSLISNVVKATSGKWNAKKK